MVSATFPFAPLFSVLKLICVIGLKKMFYIYGVHGIKVNRQFFKLLQKCIAKFLLLTQIKQSSNNQFLMF